VEEGPERGQCLHWRADFIVLCILHSWNGLVNSGERIINRIDIHSFLHFLCWLSLEGAWSKGGEIRNGRNLTFGAKKGALPLIFVVGTGSNSDSAALQRHQSSSMCWTLWLDLWRQPGLIRLDLSPWDMRQQSQAAYSTTPLLPEAWFFIYCSLLSHMACGNPGFELIRKFIFVCWGLVKTLLVSTWANEMCVEVSKDCWMFEAAP
jgi:hypothetical protein